VQGLQVHACFRHTEQQLPAQRDASNLFAVREGNHGPFQADARTPGLLPRMLSAAAGDEHSLLKPFGWGRRRVTSTIGAYAMPVRGWCPLNCWTPPVERCPSAGWEREPNRAPPEAGRYDDGEGRTFARFDGGALLDGLRRLGLRTLGRRSAGAAGCSVGAKDAVLPAVDGHVWDVGSAGVYVEDTTAQTVPDDQAHERGLPSRGFGAGLGEQRGQRCEDLGAQFHAEGFLLDLVALNPCG
jgi:hypothetical protein